MLKGKGGIVYTAMKISLLALCLWEYLDYGEPENRTAQFILILILAANSFFRQFCILNSETRSRYGKISVILDFILGAGIAWMKPVFPVLLILTGSIVESVILNSVMFGTVTNAIALTSLVVVEILTQPRQILYFSVFFRNIFVSYILGYLLVFIVSFFASLQFREKERVERANRELEQAYKRLLENAAKLRELSVEKERNRMAREIHDTLAHTLTAAVVQMEVCKKLIDVDAGRAKEEIGKAQEVTRAGLNDVKRTIKALRPEILENCSLLCAVRSLIKDMEETAQISIEFRENLEDELELPSAAEVSLFRVIQESITNAVRHGSAERIDIGMTKADNELSIDISDNGTGCAHIKEGYGIKGIVERVKGLGGTVSFSSAPGNGFQTHIIIPYKGGTDCDDQSDDS
jgi:signal transduction histidine kinase